MGLPPRPETETGNLLIFWMNGKDWKWAEVHRPRLAFTDQGRPHTHLSQDKVTQLAKNFSLLHLCPDIGRLPGHTFGWDGLVRDDPALSRQLGSM